MCDTYPFSTFLGDSAVMLFLNIYIWEYGVQWCPISALGTGRNVSPKCHHQDADHLGQMRSHILLSVWLGSEWSRDGFMLLPFPPKAIHSSQSKRTVSFLVCPLQSPKSLWTKQVLGCAKHVFRRPEAGGACVCLSLWASSQQTVDCAAVSLVQLTTMCLKASGLLLFLERDAKTFPLLVKRTSHMDTAVWWPSRKPRLQVDGM